MVYQATIGYNNSFITKDIMRNCLACNNQFINLGCEKLCSIKCKLIAGHKKEDNGCWIWQKNSCNGKYGKLRFKMKWYLTHRASYETFVGPILDKLVCHKCDNPKCINPEHLFLGTHSDNAKDAIKKGRFNQSKNFLKFTDKQVEEIRKLKQEGFTYDRLSKIFNCTFSYLNYVLKFKCRKE